MGWLVVYKAFTPGLISADNSTVRLPSVSEPQPDVCLFIPKALGGQAYRDEDDSISGSPELVGEIAYSSVSYDREIKLPVYQRDGIREYLLWRIEERAIDWFVLRGKTYDLLPIDEAGIIRSEAFPGLWLDVEAMIRGDGSRVLRVLQQGLDSPEHAEFVKKLQAGGKS